MSLFVCFQNLRNLGFELLVQSWNLALRSTTRKGQYDKIHCSNAAMNDLNTKIEGEIPISIFVNQLNMKIRHPNMRIKNKS